tara:strand:- start:57 stop:335 length:279 start_codon:yes stop_codon:yes gene_type:complete
MIKHRRGKLSRENSRKSGKLSDGKVSPGRTPENPGNFPTGNFPPENFGKSGKLPAGKISPGEFREIRETSRRENFHRRFIQKYTIFFYKNAL